MTVYLVGAGPGSSELITVKGLRLLQQADVVLYDRLTAPELLKECKSDALLINVGKSSSGDSSSQSTINQQLVDYGRLYPSVVRLKGGDPFVFGRGAEELAFCQAANIPVEVVPGISSAIAAPAYAGIPITHRDVSASFTVITGHENPEKSLSSLRYEVLAQLETLVFLMAVGNIAQIASSLMLHGLSADTPAACIENGTLPHQRILRSNLSEIADRVEAEAIRPPAVFVIGEVARLADDLAWYF